MAIHRWCKPNALLYHSNRGNQYSSEQLQRLIADNSVDGLMSRSGNVINDELESISLKVIGCTIVRIWTNTPCDPSNQCGRSVGMPSDVPAGLPQHNSYDRRSWSMRRLLNNFVLASIEERVCSSSKL